MVHAIPEGIIRVNEGDAILSLPLKRVVKNKPMVLLYIYTGEKYLQEQMVLQEAYLKDSQYVRSWG